MDETHLLNLYYDLFMAKRRVTRRLAQGNLEKLAVERGLTVDELGDLAVPNIDFNGKIIGYGHLRYQLKLMPDLSLTAQPLSPTGSQEAWTIASPTDARHQYQDRVSLLEKITTVQFILLERAMIDGRRWSLEQFEQGFLAHQIKRYLAQWLVWGVFEGDRLLKAFHITSDLALADVDYRGFALPEHAKIGVVHPLHLSEAERESWYRLLCDYEIFQPFPQILRPVYTMAAVETMPKPPSKIFIRASSFREYMGWVIFQHREKQGFRRYFPNQSVDVYVMLKGIVPWKQLIYLFERDGRAVPPAEVDSLVVSEAIYAMLTTIRELEKPLN